MVYYLVKLSPCMNGAYAAAMLVTNPLIFIKSRWTSRGNGSPVCACACGSVCTPWPLSLFSGSGLLHPVPTSPLHIWRCWCAEQMTTGCHNGQIPALYLGPVRGAGKSLALDPTICSDLSFLYVAFFPGPAWSRAWFQSPRLLLDFPCHWLAVGSPTMPFLWLCAQCVYVCACDACMYMSVEDR